MTLPESRIRPAGNGTDSGDQQATDQGQCSPESVARGRVRRALVLAVWTDNGRRTSTRFYASTAAAQRACERAEARGDRVAVVLARLAPVTVAGVDPLQVDLLAGAVIGDE